MCSRQNAVNRLFDLRLVKQYHNHLMRPLTKNVNFSDSIYSCFIKEFTDLSQLATRLGKVSMRLFKIIYKALTPCQALRHAFTTPLTAFTALVQGIAALLQTFPMLVKGFRILLKGCAVLVKGFSVLAQPFTVFRQDVAIIV